MTVKEYYTGLGAVHNPDCVICTEIDSPKDGGAGDSRGLPVKLVRSAVCILIGVLLGLYIGFMFIDTFMVVRSTTLGVSE